MDTTNSLGYTQIQIGRVQQAITDMEASASDIMIYDDLARLFAQKLAFILECPVTTDMARGCLHDLRKAGYVKSNRELNRPRQIPLSTLSADEVHRIAHAYGMYGISSDAVLIHGRHARHLRVHFEDALCMELTDDNVREVLTSLRNASRLKNVKQTQGEQLPLFDYDWD